MGQQQILLVILAVCVLAIVLSIGVLALTNHAVSDNRALVAQDLNLIAGKIQNYVNLPMEQGGGGVSFYVLSRLSGVLDNLGCPSSNSHGDYFIKKAKNASSLQIVGVGIEAGRDQKHPLRMMITVWRDSTSLSELN